MEIDIQIDSLTNCLVCRETGEQLDTEFRLVLKTISKKDAVALQQKVEIRLEHTTSARL